MRPASQVIHVGDCWSTTWLRWVLRHLIKIELLSICIRSVPKFAGIFSYTWRSLHGNVSIWFAWQTLDVLPHCFLQPADIFGVGVFCVVQSGASSASFGDLLHHSFNISARPSSVSEWNSRLEGNRGCTSLSVVHILPHKCQQQYPQKNWDSMRYAIVLPPTTRPWESFRGKRGCCFCEVNSVHNAQTDGALCNSR